MIDCDNQQLTLELAEPQTIQQADMLEALEALNPQQRTELIADMFQFWHTWHTQYQLEGMGGM